MDPQKPYTKDLAKIISQAIEKKIYGSIEVYFEAGNVTQITQRIINKIRRNDSPKDPSKKTS